MIVINNREYIMPLSWRDIRIMDAEKIYSIETPKAYAERIEIFEQSKEVENDILKWSEDVVFDDLMPFIMKCFEALTEIDSMTLKNTDPNQLLYIYFTYLEQFVFGIKTLGANVIPEDMSSFEMNGEVYSLPESKNVIESEIPLGEMTMQMFAEASDLLNLIDEQEDGFKYLSYAIACLAWKDGEEYDEDKVIDRGKAFKQMPMDIAWGVFFCSMGLVFMFESDLVSYFRAKELRVNSHKKAQDWKNTDGEDISLTCQKILKTYPLCAN